MKRIAFVLLALTAVLALGGCERREKQAAPASAVQQTAPVYYCPMHPTVTSDKPGSCPICGMALVVRNDTPTPSGDGSLSAISLSPEQRVTGNVRTMRVALDTHTGEIVTTGRVTFDERRAAQVSAYTAGRIERLLVNFTGDTVRRGQTVGTIYSPDLYATQQEYLLAIANRARMERAGFTGARTAASDLVDSTRRRLLLSGMTAAQIAQLERSGKPIFATNVISPVSGVVTRKLAVEQQYVAQGQPILEVADLSQVWVEADIYEQQLPDVSVGDRVEITAAGVPGQTFTGRVSFIVPVLAGATRTARVRIDISNPRLVLKPDMYVNVRVIGAPAPPHVMVPASAVVDRGQSKFVWIETKPGTYEPRQVITGGRHGQQIVIASGLAADDIVVVEGAFLLDSEAQLRAATSGSPASSPATTAGGHGH